MIVSSLLDIVGDFDFLKVSIKVKKRGL